MTKTYYRVVHKDGTVSPWDTDKEWIEECAKFFSGATIETKVVELP